MFSLDRHALELELLHRHRLLSLDLGGAPQSYLIREVQYDHLGTDPIHLDLLRVDLDEVVTVDVAIELVGTPKGVTHHGLLEHGIDKVAVECKASNIPEIIKARVGDLDLGDSLTVADLDMPEGVRTVTPPNEVVATIRTLTVAAEAEEAPAEAEVVSTEPEVISKGKSEAEEQAD